MASLWGNILLFFSVVAVTGTAYFSYPWLVEWLEKTMSDYIRDCEVLLDRLFKEMKRERIQMIVALLTIGFGTFAFVMTYGFGWINVLFTASFAWLGFQSFRIWLKLAWEKRIQKFNGQIVDGLNLLANSLKAGLNLSQSLQVLVQESKDPLREEFGLVLSQEKLGLTLDEALEKMLERIPSDDLTIAVQSVLILRETGGDLSETFDTIANTIRERRKITGKIAAMTQQGRLQGLILLLFPFGLMGLLYVANPPYVLPLIKTQLGWIMIFAMLVFQAVGALWIRKIVNIDV